MTAIAGLDFSYTSPAICVYNTEDEFKFDNLKLYNLGDKKTRVGTFGNISVEFFSPYSSQEERFRNITAWAGNILGINKVTSACIEGYSFGASSGLVFQIAENASLIKQYMNLNGIEFTTPSPSQVKKNLTGKGNAKKDAMVDRFQSIFPGIILNDILGVKPMAKPIDDIVDSFAVMACNEHFKEVFL